MKILKTPFKNLWKSARSQKDKYLKYLSLIGLFAVVFAFFYFFSAEDSPKSDLPPRSDLEDFQRSDLADFKNLILEAKAAFVFDISENVPLFELNADSQLPLASLAKIMTGIVAEENLPSNLLIKISEEVILQEGGNGFSTGDQWPISDLKNAMLLASSNDAAFAIANEFDNKIGGDFISLMNEKAKKIGLAQTYFLNPTGLDFPQNAAGAYGSAKDTAKLLLYAVKNHYPLMEITRFKKAIINGKEFENTDKITNDLPGFVAGKTGFSDLAGGNLAVVVDKGYGHPIIIVVLGSTLEGRFNDVKTLYKAVVSDIINL